MVGGGDDKCSVAFPLNKTEPCFRKRQWKKESIGKGSTNPSYSFSETLRSSEYMSKFFPKAPVHHIALFTSQKQATAPK